MFKKGKRISSPTLTVIYRPCNLIRMGVSVGKKHGKSVMRNRIKRLVRESFRNAAVEMKGGYAFVIVPKVREEYSYSAFERDLKWMIKKENL